MSLSRGIRVYYTPPFCVMAEKRDNCVKELCNYLDKVLPKDEFIEKWKQNYDSEFFKKRPILKRTRSVVKNELKERLLQSYSDKYEGIVGELPGIESVDNCVKSIKLLENWIIGNKRNILYFSVLQGQAINVLKQYKRENIGVYLFQHGIHFSVSHCNALVRLFKLNQEFPKLQNCSIEVGTVIKHMKTIKEICKELGWNH